MRVAEKVKIKTMNYNFVSPKLLTVFFALLSFVCFSQYEYTESELENKYQKLSLGENECMKTIFEFEKVVRYVDETPKEQLEKDGVEKLFNIAFPGRDIPSEIREYSFNTLDFDYMNPEFVGLKDNRAFTEKMIGKMKIIDFTINC